MKYLELYTLILEADLSYVVPKEIDKQILDFYVSSLNMSSKHASAESMMTRAYEESSDAMTEAHNKVVDSLYPLIKEAVFFALCSEFRHLEKIPSKSKEISKEVLARLRQYNTWMWRSYNIKDLEKETGRKFNSELNDPRLRASEKNNDTDRRQSYKILSTLFPDRISLVKTMSILFNIDKCWRDSGLFAGPLWTAIADAWIQLAEAKTVEQKSVAIDHILDLQHNNATVFDKIKYFYKQGGYAWLATLLSMKRHAKTPWELYDYVSSGMQKIMPPYLKASGLGAKDVQTLSPKYKKLFDTFNITELDRHIYSDLDDWCDAIDSDNISLADQLEFIKIFADRINWKQFKQADFKDAISRDNAVFLYPIAIKNGYSIPLNTLKNGLLSRIFDYGASHSIKQRTQNANELKKMFTETESMIGSANLKAINEMIDKMLKEDEDE